MLRLTENLALFLDWAVQIGVYCIKLVEINLYNRYRESANSYEWEKKMVEINFCGRQ